MAKVEDLLQLPDKISKRSDYIRGHGYKVTVRTTYTRTRKVRAMDAAMAETFALSREAKFAPRYFDLQNHQDCEIEDISIVDVVPVEESDG